jgi:hypothetical protein
MQISFSGYTTAENRAAKTWMEYIADSPVFYEQSRQKRPVPDLTRAELVGLDGCYLDNAPHSV